jgi:hypothetical protein
VRKKVLMKRVTTSWGNVHVISDIASEYKSAGASSGTTDSTGFEPEASFQVFAASYTQPIHRRLLFFPVHIAPQNQMSIKLP